MKSEGGALDVRLAKPVRMDQLSELLARAVGTAADHSKINGTELAPGWHPPREPAQRH